MVNFENDQTIATAPKQVVNMIVIEHYYNLLSALERYNELKLQGSPGNLSKVRSRLITLIQSQYNAFKRTYDNQKDQDKWDLIKKILDTNNKLSENEILNVLYLTLVWLDEKQLTKLDDRVKRDYTNIWEDNEVNGFT